MGLILAGSNRRKSDEQLRDGPSYRCRIFRQLSVSAFYFRTHFTSTLNTRASVVACVSQREVQTASRPASAADPTGNWK